MPGRSSKEHYKRDKCFPCNSGMEGGCRRTDVGYQIKCNLCDENLRCEYAGETGKNLFMRGSVYVKDVEKKKSNKPLWKHIEEKH